MLEFDAWHVTAAYLYILGLDDRGLAWEALRRNPAYRAAFAKRAPGAAADEWGLRAFEDPACDARAAEPLWIEAPSALTLVPATPTVDSDGFDLWALPAPRRLVHDGQVLRATVGRLDATLRLCLARTLRQGRPFAYQLPGGRAASAPRRRGVAIIAGIEDRAPLPTARPARRDALVRMRTFTAYDGHRAGASQRDIAVALFGSDAVRRGWSAESELRARVRYLVARGRQLVEGGYRALLATGENGS